MKILNGEESAEFLENITYLEKQATEKGIDLTVSNIYEFENRGEIDFGGGERNDAKIEKIEPELRDPEDEYGWWELDPGTYLLEHNERLIQKKICFLQPLPRINKNSATIPSGFVSELDLVPIHVGSKGIAIKENSRVTKLLIIEE